MTFRQLTVILLLILAITACQSGINRLEVSLEENPDPGSLDSLKYALTGLNGITTVAMSPDKQHITLHYDRFQTHSDVIISCIKSHGYTPQVIEKKPVNEEAR